MPAYQNSPAKMLVIVTFMASQSRGRIHSTMRSTRKGEKEEKGMSDLSFLNKSQSFIYNGNTPLSLALYTSYQAGIIDVANVIGGKVTNSNADDNLMDFIDLKNDLKLPQECCKLLDVDEYKNLILEQLYIIYDTISAAPKSDKDMTQKEYMAKKAAVTVCFVFNMVVCDVVCYV